MIIILKTKFFNLFRYIFKISAFEKWLRENTIGKPQSDFYCKLVPNNYQYPFGTIKKIQFKEIILEVDIHDYVGHFLFFGFRDIAQERLIELSNPGNVVIDVGTNIGSSLLQFAKKIGSKGRVYGFEPDPFNYKKCLKNVSLNKFQNIEISNIGLGNESGKFSLIVDTESNRGGNRISFDKKTNKATTQIEVRKLDDWVSSKNIERVDLIKIDVEGFELKVLQGGRNLIEQFKPKLFIEIDDNNLRAVGDSAKKLISFLEDLNYKSINAVSLESINLGFNFDNCHFDIISEKVLQD